MAGHALKRPFLDWILTGSFLIQILDSRGIGVDAALFLTGVHLCGLDLLFVEDAKQRQLYLGQAEGKVKLALVCIRGSVPMTLGE